MPLHLPQFFNFETASLTVHVSPEALPLSSQALGGPVLRLVPGQRQQHHQPPGSPDCAALTWCVDGGAAARALAAAAPGTDAAALAAAAGAELAAFARCLARGRLAVEVFDADSGLQVRARTVCAGRGGASPG